MSGDTAGQYSKRITLNFQNKVLKIRLSQVTEKEFDQYQDAMSVRMRSGIVKYDLFGAAGLKKGLASGGANWSFLQFLNRCR